IEAQRSAVVGTRAAQSTDRRGVVTTGADIRQVTLRQRMHTRRRRALANRGRRVTARVGAISESQCTVAAGTREITDGRREPARGLRVAAESRRGNRSRVGPGTKGRGERRNSRGIVADRGAVLAYSVGVVADRDGPP